jgi:hypothetical protein
MHIAVPAPEQGKGKHKKAQGKLFKGEIGQRGP